MNDTREILYWTCDPDGEHGQKDDKDEAIEWNLDGRNNIMPTTVTVYGFARMQPETKRLEERVLDIVLDELGEEYGDPEDDFQPTPEGLGRMEAAARAFVAAVLDDYTVWACEQVTEETVNVREWIAEHRPDWGKEEGRVSEV